MEELLIKALESSPLAAVLGAAVYVFHKGVISLIKQYKENNDALMIQLTEERKAFENERKESISDLRVDVRQLIEKSDICEKDRAKLTCELAMLKSHLGVKFSIAEKQ